MSEHSNGGGPLLSVRGLTVHYGPAQALRDLDLTIDRGAIVAVLGANGAGKTSLARAISGLVRPTAGRIELDGQDITGRKAQQVTRAGVMYLPEGRGVFTSLSVRDNLRMWAMAVPRAERDDAVVRALDLFPVLAQRRQQAAGSLSGGEQQMLSLARAFVVRPALLVADELSLGLAPKMVDVVFDGLQRISDDGITVVMIEQFVHRALALATDCVVVRRGSVAWQGSPDEAEDQVLQHYLGGTLDEVGAP